MNRLFIVWFNSVWLCASVCSAHEYIYPVAYCSHKNTLFFVHQKSLDCLELWALQDHHQPVKVLSSFFIPAGFKLLPDYTGFSFIHHDTLYLKRFDKRSPQRIEFYEPLYGINTVDWIDAGTCYFSAREHQRYRMYQATIDGDVQRIIDDDATDAVYPQKVGSNLFYIERDDSCCRIIHTAYDAPLCRHVLCTVDYAIAFLHMISDTEGFFLEYPAVLDQDQEILVFKYHHLWLDTGFWRCTLLFSFALPKNLLLGDHDDRLYESIVPCIPQYHHGYLYYVDYSQTDSSALNTFCYELSTGNSARINTVMLWL